MSKAARWIVESAVTAVVGLVAFIAPIMLHPPPVLPKAPLFPIVREAVEHLRPSSFIALAIVGLIAGLVAGAPWWVLGLVSVAALPVCMVAELLTDSTSHNLFPFELVTYVVFSIPALVAAGLGRAARRVVISRRQKNPPHIGG